MAIFKIYLYFMTLVSYSCFDNKDIVIVGTAQNEKAGAVVISRDDEKMYYLDGLVSWDERSIGKLVKVTGRLVEEKKEPPSNEDPIKQQIIGIKRIIQKPKWEFIK